MQRRGTASWRGALKDGEGTVSTGSGVLKQTPYSFHTRFENQLGTNPEELIAAAHASCFSMAFANELGSAGTVPEEIVTTAAANLDKGVDGWAVNAIHLECRVRVSGADEAAVRGAAEKAKNNCPISKLLKATISLDLRVESTGESKREPRRNATGLEKNAELH
jgi:lipoyl-dependent peroxiredoxin